MSNPAIPSGEPETGSARAPYVPPARPSTVVVGTIMSWVGAAFGAVIGIALIAASGDQDFQDQAGVGSDGAASVRLIGVLMILWSALVAALALQAFRRKRWGAIGLAVLGGIFVAFTLFNMLASGSLSPVVGVAWTVTAVVLIFRGSREWHATR